MGLRISIYLILCTASLACGAADAYGQKYPERAMVRQGNKEFYKGDYAASEIDYRRALENNPGSAEASFNLGNALYKLERYEEAGKTFTDLGAESSDHSLDRSQVHYNNGNALFRQRKLEEALEEYKKALRINPDDREAKFNLAYVRKLLEKDNQQQQDDQDQDKDQDQDQDQQQQQNQNQQDEGNSDQDQQDNSGNEQDQDQGDDPRQEDGSPSQGISREEAEQMLEAIQYREDQTREKVEKDKAAAAAAAPSGKNW